MSALLSSSTPSPASTRGLQGRRGLISPARLLLASALVVLAVTLPAVRGAEATSFGLLFAGLPGLAVAAVLAIAGSLLGLMSGRRSDQIAGLLTTVACLRLPAVLGVDLPLYGWAYKHIGVVDYIATHGSVAHGVDIYAAWPGAFAAVAWFTTVTGLPTLELAQWFPVLVHAAQLVGIYAVARAFGLTKRVSLLAALLAEILNWVGQDYFSPQAITFTLALAVIALLLRSRTRPVLGWLSLPILAAIVVAHQLTPYWLIAVAVLLGLFGRVRPRYIGALFLLVAGAYLLVNIEAVLGYGVISLDGPVSNARTTAMGAGSEGHLLTAGVARAITLLLWGSAAAVAVLQYVRGGSRRTAVVTPVVLAFAPLGLLLAQNYGGEALLRVFLYSIPGSVILLAPVLARMLDGRASLPGLPRGRLVLRGAAFAAVLAVGVGALQANYGGWFGNVVQRATYQEMSELLRSEPSDTIFVRAMPTGPEKLVADYVRFATVDPGYDYTLGRWEGWDLETFESPAVLERLTEDLAAADRPILFVVTEQMRRYAQYYGTFPDGGFERLVDQLRASPRWTEEVDEKGIVVFRLVPAA